MLANKQLTESLHRKPFPCPLCKQDLPLALSVRGKPYCVCNVCGIQVFFRGLSGIKRLQVVLSNKSPMAENFPAAPDVVALYNRLEELRREKSELEDKQRMFFRDQALDNAIAAVAKHIEEIETTIRDASAKTESKK